MILPIVQPETNTEQINILCYIPPVICSLITPYFQSKNKGKEKQKKKKPKSPPRSIVRYDCQIKSWPRSLSVCLRRNIPPTRLTPQILLQMMGELKEIPRGKQDQRGSRRFCATTIDVVD